MLIGAAQITAGQIFCLNIHFRVALHILLHHSHTRSDQMKGGRQERRKTRPEPTARRPGFVT